MTIPNQPGGVPDPSANQPPAGGYPPPAGYPSGGMPQVPGSVPPAAGYPPPGYSPAGGYPPGGAYPPAGTYLPPTGAVPGAGYPPPPGGQMPPPGGQIPPPPGVVPPKKRNVRLIVTLSVVAVLVVVGIVSFLVNRKSNPANAKVGDCVTVNSVSSTNADVKRVDCSDPTAVYKVTAVSDSKAVCDPAEAEYTEKTKSGTTSTDLCLQPNVTAGDCLKLPADENTAPSKVDCAANKGQSDVVKILLFDHTTSDASKCPDGTKQDISYTVHPGILCATTND